MYRHYNVCSSVFVIFWIKDCLNYEEANRFVKMPLQYTSILRLRKRKKKKKLQNFQM